MKLESLYRVASRRHGQLGMDVAHDMICKFGEDLPNPAYLSKCIQHAKPQPMHQIFEAYEEPLEDPLDDDVMNNLLKAVSTTALKYEVEVDIFLNCQVNGTLKQYQKRSGISRSTLEKICKFAQYEILKEFNRIEKLG